MGKNQTVKTKKEIKKAEIKEAKKQEAAELERKYRDFMAGILYDYKDKHGKDSAIYKYFKEERSKEAEAKRQRYIEARAINEEEAKKLRLLSPEAQEKSGKAQRRSYFYDELYLNDYAYKQGDISDTEYYVWLVEYLDATTVGKNKTKPHAIYYKEAKFDPIFTPEGNWPLYMYLIPLLQRGLQLTREEVDKAECDKQYVEERLEELNARLHGNDAKEVKGRLTKIRYGDNKDYLLYLTARLRMVALHLQVVEFFRNCDSPLHLNGNKVVLRESGEDSKETTASGKKNYRKESKLRHHVQLVLSQIKDSGSGVQDHGFISYVKSAEEADALLDEVNDSLAEEDDEDCNVIIPIETDSVSGCMLAIVGKANYAGMYEAKAKREDGDWKNRGVRKRFLADYQHFRDSEQKCCFDILYLDMKHLFDFQKGSEITQMASRNGALWFKHRLLPRFHRNVNLKYEDVRIEFESYCIIKNFYKQKKQDGSDHLPVWLDEDEMPDYWKGDAGGKPESPRDAVRINQDIGFLELRHIPEGLKEFFDM